MLNIFICKTYIIHTYNFLLYLSKKAQKNKKFGAKIIASITQIRRKSGWKMKASKFAPKTLLSKRYYLLLKNRSVPLRFK